VKTSASLGIVALGGYELLGKRLIMERARHRLNSSSNIHTDPGIIDFTHNSHIQGALRVVVFSDVRGTEHTGYELHEGGVSASGSTMFLIFISLDSVGGPSLPSKVPTKALPEPPAKKEALQRWPSSRIVTWIRELPEVGQRPGSKPGL